MKRKIFNIMIRLVEPSILLPIGAAACIMIMLLVSYNNNIWEDAPPPDLLILQSPTTRLEQTSATPVCVYHFTVLVTCKTAVGYEPECTVDRTKIIERSAEQAKKQCELEKQND